MIKTKKDGRVIRTGKDYTEFRKGLWILQQYRCIDCGCVTDISIPIEYPNSFHIAHRGSRGMGGAIRNDALGPRRGDVEGGKCGKCHRKEHRQA